MAPLRFALIYDEELKRSPTKSISPIAKQKDPILMSKFIPNELSEWLKWMKMAQRVNSRRMAKKMKATLI